MTVETNTKVITATSNMSKLREDPIRIPSNYPQRVQSAGKIARSRCDWFCFRSHWLKNWREAQQSQSRKTVLSLSLVQVDGAKGLASPIHRLTC